MITTRQRLLQVYESAYFDAVYYDILLTQDKTPIKEETRETLTKWRETAYIKMNVCCSCLSAKDLNNTLRDVRYRAVTKAKEVATCWINSRKYKEN